MLYKTEEEEEEACISVPFCEETKNERYPKKTNKAGIKHRFCCLSLPNELNNVDSLVLKPPVLN